MKPLNCLIIEDEPLASDVLVKYVQDSAFLRLIAVCRDATQAGLAIQQNPVDLIFLDINLPGISGIRFLKTLHHPPLVIFTTAYPEFAVEGFENEAVDFLLKPFSQDRFLKAVNKALEWQKYQTDKVKDKEINDSCEKDFILFRSDKKVYRVEFNDIEYFEAVGDYIKVIAGQRRLLVHDTVKHILEQLPVAGFLQVHKSFIISLNKIDYLEGNQINIGGQYIPIGLVYKDRLLESLNKIKR